MLRKTALAIAALGAVGAATLGGIGVAQAAPGAGSSGTLFEQAGFRGASQGITGNVGDCVPVGLGTTGSLRNVTGQLTLFDDADCKGVEGVFTNDEADLGRFTLQTVRSVQIGPAN
jgi:hypothetical protein